MVLADRTLPADTPVIVKTSLNHGGETERYLPAAELARLGMHLAAPGVGPDYRVMPAGDMPGPSWDDKALCIERFISNDEGRYHRAYLWQDRLVLWEGINPAPIKKSFADTSNRLLRFVLVEGRYRAAAGSDTGPEALLAQLAAFAPAIGLSFCDARRCLRQRGPALHHRREHHALYRREHAPFSGAGLRTSSTTWAGSNRQRHMPQLLATWRAWSSRYELPPMVLMVLRKTTRLLLSSMR